MGSIADMRWKRNRSMEDGSVETRLKEQREKTLKENEESFSHLSDNIKYCNICVIGFLCEERKKGAEKNA